MTIAITRILSFDEYKAMGEKAVADGFYRNDRRVFVPGMAWYEPWYHCPAGWEYSGRQMIPNRPDNINDRAGFLSPHYWSDWADKRPPIAVVCPNGEVWEIDRWSSNGTGWKVEGELPRITCSPSIVVEGYHGFLRHGLFTADVDGRPPNGIPRPI